MSDQRSLDSDLSEPPMAIVKTRKTRFSLVWLVPVVAALIGGWLVVKALIEKGPEITITFRSAEGLEAGKTKVKFKDVEIGKVVAIVISDDFKGVVVKAELVKYAERLLSENTRFWVVRARVSASAIYGLGTLFSGAYIDVDPGKPGNTAREFIGLEAPPIVTTGLPGRHFILESERRESLEVGSPVYYRQIRAGEVVAYRLSDDGSKIVAKVFVHAPYHVFVRRNSRFWSASGVDLKLDASGIRLYTESLVSIMVGGIAFDTFKSASDPGEQAQENSIFKLFPSREAAQEKVYNIKNYYVLYFDESVRGLSRGAPVEFRGIEVGEVIDVKSELDLKTNKVRIPVIVAFEPERISFIGELPERVTEETFVEYLVQSGLRAQLRRGSLLTGQLYVALDLFPNAKPAKIVRSGRYGLTEFPTTTTSLEEIGSKVTELVAKIDRLPIEQLAFDLRDTIQGAKRITNSPELLEALTSFNAAVKELQLLTAELRTRTTPEFDSTLEQARRSLAAAESTLSADSPLQNRLTTALEEFASAARALKVLADYLERHPESTLFGKGKAE